jgi:arylsulfatase A-like enzyme
MDEFMFGPVKLALAAGIALLLSSAAPHAEPPTIVLISIDTLRADHLGTYGYRAAMSPFLDELADSGTLFEEAVVPLPATGPSHASLFTGNTPWKHGLGVNGIGMAAGVDTLPMALRRAGYYTVGAVAVTHLGTPFGFARGFDRFFEPEYAVRMTDNRRDSTQMNEVVKGAVDDYLRHDHAKPLFLFVHYFDCHYPYRWWDPSDPDKSIVWTPAEMRNRRKQIVRYDSGVRRVDAAIRQLHAYLQAKGLLRNAVFVVTADHGEQIGDHQFDVGHADIYRETVRVPLMIAGAGFPRRLVAETVSTMDIAPTLARLGGARFAAAVSGRDLQPVIDRAASWWQRGWLASDAPRRLLTVTGAPQASRSVELIDGKLWFIKNFDSLYREAWVAAPAPPADRPTTRVEQVERGVDDVLYRLPNRVYRPHLLTIEHVAASPECAATAVVKMLPTARYFNEPIPFRGSIRIVVPSGRLDSVALVVAPPACAGETFYDVARFGEAKLPPVAPRTTDLFKILLVARKTRADDELYDVAADPSMAHPIRDHGLVSVADRALAERFAEVAAVKPENLTVPLEEQRRLRSLGYVQQ